MKKASMNKITGFNIMSTILLQGITLFTSPIFSRFLGTSNYGIVSVYNTWVSLFAVVFGLQTQSTISISKNEFKEEEQLKYQSSILSLSLLSFVILSVVLTLLINPLSNFMNMSKAMFIVMLFHSFGLFCVNFINMKFTYEFKAGMNLILSVTASLSNVLISLFFIYTLPYDINYWGRIIGLAGTYITLGFIICAFMFFRGKETYNYKFWKYCLPISIPVIFHSLSGLILNQSDRVMLQSMSTNSYVGIYSLAYAFGSILSTIWNSLNNSWAPFYYDFTRKNMNDAVIKHARHYIELYTVLCIGFILLTPEVYHIFAAKEYWEGTRLITVFAIGFYMIFMYSFPVNYEFFNKRSDLIAIGSTIVAVINIGLNVILIHKFNIMGAAIATALSYILLFSFHCIIASYISKKQKVNYQFNLKFFMPYILCFYLVCFVTMWMNSDYTLLRWGLGIALGLFEIYRICKRKSIF